MTTTDSRFLDSVVTAENYEKKDEEQVDLNLELLELSKSPEVFEEWTVDNVSTTSFTEEFVAELTSPWDDI